MIRKIFLAAALFATIGAQAQSYQEKARAYIQQYQTWAQEEQRRSGVPAAITLGQGILETSAGESELATQANNHFGIKCKKSWQGETFAHDDDAPQECFRKYPSAYDSYRDHSDYLKNSPRYASCFALNPADYQGWARELRRCGYATNPRYSQQLIKIIEDFQLQDHTYAALRPAAPNGAMIASTAAPAAAAMMAEEGKPTGGTADTPTQTVEKQPAYGEIIKQNGVRGFYAQKGDVLLEYAIRHKIRYARLLELNGLPDAPLNKDQFVAIESGNRLVRIISHDGSQPAPAPTAEKTFVTASTNSTPAPEVPAAAPAASNTTSVKPAAVAAPKPATVASVAAVNAPKPQANVAPAATTPATSAQVASAPTVASNSTPVSKPASAAQPKSAAPAATTEKPFNIADEEAIDDRRGRYIPPSQRNYTPTASNRTQTPASTSPTAATNSPVAVTPQQTLVAPAVTSSPVQKPAAPVQTKSENENADEVKTSSKKQEDEEDEDDSDEEVASNQPSKTTSANSEFDQMKARFDKVVYAPTTAKPAFTASSTTTTPATTASPNNNKPEVNAAPAATTNVAGGQYHTVKSGETAYGIAKQYGISMKELMSMNNLNFEAIRVGQKLRVK
jgi:LysM repeat protein